MALELRYLLLELELELELVLMSMSMGCLAPLGSVVGGAGARGGRLGGRVSR